MARWQGWLPALSLAVLAGLGLTGCGEGDGAPRGDLRGKVTYKGNALPAGSSLVLYNPAGGGASAVIDASGNYSLKAKVGNYVAIVNPPAKLVSAEEAMKAAQEKKPIENATPFPEKYGDPSTSPAKVEVKQGKNEFNLDMTDE